MASILQIENLSKSFGDRIIFEGININLSEGDKVGIIAKNGIGKTTLMNIIMGRETYDSGKITFRNDIKVGYLEQLPVFNPEDTIIEACLSGDNIANYVVRQYEIALEKGEDLTDLIVEMDSADAWDLEDRFKQFLTELKFSDFSQKISTLSGGQIKRLAIAKLFIDKPDLILLDEPTNHLDIDMVEWLENYLSRNRITLLMVTHDRYFLDKICDRIVEIDNQTVYNYNGNYNYYLEKRAQRIEQQNAEIAKAANLYRKELDWMRRQPQARATKAKYRIDAFYDLKQKATMRYDNSSISLKINSSYIGSKIFEARNLCKRFGDKVIIDGFNYIFARYDKLGIIGDNGVGKSTFIKILQQIEPLDSGELEIGETVKFGYYRQDFEKFDESKKVIDYIRDIAEVIYFDEKTCYTASQFLSHFLFTPADQQKYIYKLSGGEKRRLYLAAVLMKKPNFLILDEPTNDLDILSLEILEDYLDKFKGCVIVISHDRFFMDRCINHLFVFKGNGEIKDFPGNYSEYRAWAAEQEKIKAQNEVAQSVQSTHRNEHSAKNKLTYKEKLELQALSEEIEKMELEKTNIERIFNGETTLPPGSSFDLVSQRYSAIKDMLDEKELRWLELSDKES
ncbi:MAG: ABC-F family ATP-binding cassette domain-containing protein [Muribaculaceae bacterium]|nr:ABC-F family ATP-binding cassette domain-containing protein [Muribaculaceae bacterium]